MRKSYENIDWEDPELEEWEDDDDFRNDDDRCLPAVAVVVALGAAAYCRPRRYCYPSYGCRPNTLCFPYRSCYPRPCLPL